MADGPYAAFWGDGIYLGSFVIVSLVDAPEGMSLVARGVFDRPAGRRLLEGFRSLLAAVVAAPSQPLSQFVVDVGPPPLDIGDRNGEHQPREDHRLDSEQRQAGVHADEPRPCLACGYGAEAKGCHH